MPTKIEIPDGLHQHLHEEFGGDLEVQIWGRKDASFALINAPQLENNQVMAAVKTYYDSFPNFRAQDVGGYFEVYYEEVLMLVVSISNFTSEPPRQIMVTVDLF
ncbi:MAG: hypothetical protein A2849_02280 [Candidatus Taylorbacteria bacterium RIFCSPHIGHO2_01_FULL_51_15]|uniref:Uncharacterized protein n=1 Tax=Candidatus Taylorbacteria bacterium RIFCSPHIGHO2_01_FULL_51_15 TaxID=1802304 RepID=A0A1G2MDQ5_9BACT|nr:MAG: hypothetical protein A2849_02280 [Candidatus Taylorbacteria bacterium RIFCSPHIGHO2_01_FULL_51_15]